MTTSVPPPDERSVNATSAGEEAKAMVSSHLTSSQPAGAKEAPQGPFFYFEDDERLDEDALLDESEPSFAMPFQASDAMTTVAQQAPSSGQETSVPPVPSGQAPKPRGSRWLSFPVIAMLIGVVVVVGLLALTVLAQATPALQTRQRVAAPGAQKVAQSQQNSTHQPPAPAKPAQALPAGQPQAAPNAANWVPQALPDGWIQAGLSTGDAIQALRTATTFTDREMSLDYRSVGTPNNHGGTFTAATFLLTPAAQQRFLRNDVRAFNNVLFDQVQETQVIRLVIDPQPRLVAFTQQGQQQFAWVTVAFQMWQSRLDPNHPGQRVEGIEIDPATKQPRTRQMMVLLLRVPPQNAGPNPPMGGTGWLVSNYGLDLPGGTRLPIVQPA